MGPTTSQTGASFMSYLSLTTRTGHTVTWTEIIPQTPYQETLVFLSGLADDTKVWEPLITNLKASYRIFLINLIGQGESLSIDTQQNVSGFKVSIEEQSQALEQILNTIPLNSPFHLIGFSYGGAVALEYQRTNTDRVITLNLWLPFVIRLDFSSPVSQIWKSNMDILTQYNPLARYFSKRWSLSYHQWLSHYMHFRFSKRVPQFNLRQVAVEMSQGALDYNGLSQIKNIKSTRVNLVISHMDTLVPVTLYNQIWDTLPIDSKGLCLRVRDGEHLLHEQSPQLLAKWLEHCLNNLDKPPQELDGWAASAEFNRQAPSLLAQSS